MEFTEAGFVPSSNPVTVDTVTRGDRLANIARRQHPKILQTYGGEYSDPKLERTLARVVGKLTLDPDNPSQAYRIAILDSPNINAFALPGGYLYVSRGLLALANDSAEVAAVLAHEMAHVTANHGLERQKREAEANLTNRVVDEVVSSDVNARAAALRGKLLLAQFSRNQELEADRIGIRSIGRAGYDPYAASRFLRSMDAYQSFRDVSGTGESSLDFLASHPNTPRRIELAQEHARQFGAPGTGARDREAYLQGIDGMVYGDKPDEGYVRGRDFLHPTLGVALSVPEGFMIDNSTGEVTAKGPDDLAFRFDGTTVSRGTTLKDYLQGDWLSGLDPSSIRETSINGREAATARAYTDEWQFDVTVIRVGEQVYRLLTVAPLDSDRLDAVARTIADSFRVLDKAEIAALKPLRVRVETVGAGDTVATFANRMRGVDRKLELFRMLNGLGPGSALSVGDKVKIVTDR
ncbi:M48 family metalloprotease [Chelativorans xinjiangense]|uniref:M48 family metalloprotease n=1 Tax=Chelativorans xinjiangense TaxID=2681485 RepID=UPI0013593392|nr:M48 family metalloprotease [Chelativorans xinjiangense]